MPSNFDRIFSAMQDARAGYHVTLGKLIERLESLEGEGYTITMTKPASYRGYYEDLAYAPCPEDERAELDSVLEQSRDALGSVFTGYKGGDYRMHEDTPLWLADWGVTGPAITGLITDHENKLVKPMTRKVE